VLFLTTDDRLVNTIRVVELETGEVLPFGIEVPREAFQTSVVWGRARWTDNGRAIAFIGRDERERSGVFVQDFVPSSDGRSTPRKLAGFHEDYVTESLGISPDGKRLMISAMQEIDSVMLADGVPGARFPDRDGPR
jgi:hypothetical protein